MSLAAAWRRQGAWATAVTFLVPGALVLAVFTALLGGGFRGLGALGQVVTGPQVPEARLAASAFPARHHAARLPTVPVLRPVAGSLGAGPGAGPAGSEQAPPPAPVATVPPRRSAAPPTGAGSAPAAPPAQPDRPPSSPVRQVGQQIADDVGATPGVGPAGHDAVITVIDVIVPPPAVARALPAP